MDEETVVITASEAESLEDHLEYYIFQAVRDNPDFDNINCLCNLVHVYEKCHEVAERRRTNRLFGLTESGAGE